MKRAILLLPLLLLLSSGAPAQAPAQPPADKKQAWAEQEYEKQLTLLGSNDSIQRAKAIEGLRRVGLPKGVVPLLDKSLKEPLDFLVRLAGESARILDPALALEHLTALVTRHHRGARGVRRNLVILLSELAAPESGEMIVDDFGNAVAKEVVIEVIRAIGVRRIEKGISLVKRALSAKDSEVRNVAAVAAGNFGSIDFIPQLLGALENSDDQHCKFAAWALTRIDDAGIFGQVVSRLGSASGLQGEAKAKALEGCARDGNVERLVSILSSSKAREYREAAAVALGRLGDKSMSVQVVLFARMLRDRDREVRGACWHALGRVATEELVPSVKKRQNQRDPEKAKYIAYLIGDLRIEDGAPILMKWMVNAKDIRQRFSAAINFWKVADRARVRAFEERIEKASGEFLERGVDALGFRRTPDGFRFLVRLLQVFRDGSEEEFLVEKALERVTGHFFGNSHGIWKKWFKRNPDFFSPKQSELERNKWREEFEKENKGFRQTEETEYTVQLGLEYLARHQHPDGRFDAQKLFDQCEARDPCSKGDGARVQMDPSGTTAISLLAFLGAGYAPDEGKYHDVVRRGLEYLMARQQAGGNFLANDLLGGYNRPISAQAFAEAYTLTQDEAYGWHAQKSLDFLTTIQNRLGGWRYRVVIETTDTSVMSWNLFALKAGQKAGLETKEVAFAGCYHIMDLYSELVTKHREDFIDIDPEYGYDVGRNTSYEYETGYQNPVWDTKYATVPLGIMCRIFLGWRRSHPFCIGSANKVLADMMEEVPKNEDWSLYRSRREYPTYAWYYGTLAMHQMGGKYFRKWNESIRQVIPKTQKRTGCARGSWRGWNHDGFFGSIYTTSMGVLSLETYYRYLPVLQD